MIRGVGIEKAIGDRPILSGVDVEVGQGKALAVVGPNGSGKSTLLRAISLVDPPSRGVLRIGSREFRFSPETPQEIEGLWPTITLVFQQLFLWPHMTLEENVLLPTRGKLPPAEARRALDELAAELSVAHLLKRFPNQASQGERQRVAVLRALILKPDYLLLDEVTSALDVEQMERLLQVLLRAKEGGTTLIFVSHFLGFVRKLADDFIFMDKGQVIERGNREGLISPSTERMTRFLAFAELSVSSPPQPQSFLEAAY